MKKTLYPAFAAAAIAAGLGANVQADTWQFQFSGLDLYYDWDRSYAEDATGKLGTEFGIATGDATLQGTVPNLPTLRDNGSANLNQEFGNSAKADPLTEIEIYRNNVLYGTLDSGIYVDFRIVLGIPSYTPKAPDPGAGNTFFANLGEAATYFGTDIATAGTLVDLDSYTADPFVVAPPGPGILGTIDVDRSFFDLFTETSGTDAWGIALDTSRELQFAIATTQGVTGTGVKGVIFGAPGSFDLPVNAIAPGGVGTVPLRSKIAEPTDIIAFSFSANPLTFLNGACTPSNPTDLDCNSSDFFGSGTGEIGFNSEPVPAPATLALLGLGMMGLGAARRARRG